jgi:uncharacterized protein
MNTLDPIVYFFVLGFLARVLRADLRMPPAIYDFVTTLLLLGIGLKGGRELARQPLGGIGTDLLAVIALGTFLALLAFVILRLIARGLSRADTASLAAHYGSVSVATFAVGIAYLQRQMIPFEPRLSLFLVVMEIPALIVGVLLAQAERTNVNWRALGHEILLGRSMVLLLGGLGIGYAAGPDGLDAVSPLFFDLFKGVLAIFLLEMGLTAADNPRDFKRAGLVLVLFAITIPLLFATIGLGVAQFMDLSRGGAVLLATLAASASYIAAPATMRAAVPQANVSLSITASLAITFPFNIFFGIPLYDQLAQWLYA